MIDNTMNVPILCQNFFDEDDQNYIKILNKEIDRLVNTNGDCWGRLDMDDNIWCSYAMNKDILFNNEIFDALSYKIKDTILQYTMAVRADTQGHQVHLMDSSIFVCRSNPYKSFKSDDSQHFKGILYLGTTNNFGNIILKNPCAPPKRFHHTGSGPLKEYHVLSSNPGDIVIFPSHIESKMSDFTYKDNELKFILFNITVA